jgi:hypothetical protein
MVMAPVAAGDADMARSGNPALMPPRAIRGTFLAATHSCEFQKRGEAVHGPGRRLLAAWKADMDWRVEIKSDSRRAPAAPSPLPAISASGLMVKWTLYGAQIVLSNLSHFAVHAPIYMVLAM